MSKSVDKAIAVLNCLSLERPILGVGDISGLTGYTKSTVSRLLTTLQRHGCVERAGGHGKYQLGYRINLWANKGVRQHNLVNIARSVMEKLRDKCGEEIALYVIAYAGQAAAKPTMVLPSNIGTATSDSLPQ